MSRSLWATAGACAVALVTVPGVALAKGGDGSSRASGGSTPTTATQQPGQSHASHNHTRSGRMRARAAVRAGHRSGYLLVPGSGYQQAAGSTDVRSLQRGLRRLGFAPGPIDGRYGPLTTHSVERFQAAVGLAIDGVAGPHTLAALSATHRALLAPGAGLRRPSGSRAVRALQRRLAHLGFRPGPVDGRYGPVTTGAVKRLQRKHHLLITGVVGVRTLAALHRTGHRAVPQGARGGLSRIPAVPTVASPGPAPRRVQPRPALPVAFILLALALVGLATLIHSYRKTRRQIRPGRGAVAAGALAATTPRPTPTPTAGEQVERMSHRPEARPVERADHRREARPVEGANGRSAGTSSEPLTHRPVHSTGAIHKRTPRPSRIATNAGPGRSQRPKATALPEFVPWDLVTTSSAERHPANGGSPSRGTHPRIPAPLTHAAQRLRGGMPSRLQQVRAIEGMDRMIDGYRAVRRRLESPRATGLVGAVARLERRSRVRRAFRVQRRGSAR